MRPYIIINGKNSREIEGLIISSLPAITKPPVRTNIEEINGRDGDIITKLGYASYDKSLNIGLSYKYNIDEVINFFNTEGEITFSNEPDKYYRFQVIDEINFEKLINFKTATVNIHCQPFKFSLVEKEKKLLIDKHNSDLIKNKGNVISKPIYTIKGIGKVIIIVNFLNSTKSDKEKKITINFGDELQTIVIDSENLEAYELNTKKLINRAINGDYKDLYLKPGLSYRFSIKNEISEPVEGNIREFSVKNYSRWI